MDIKSLFAQALSITEPFYVEGITFEAPKEELGFGETRVMVSFPRGATFPCPKCGKPCKVFDTRKRTFRHLDFFQHKCFIDARCPRVSCDEHGVLTTDLPWEGTGTGFTELFEMLATALCKEMPVLSAARLLRMDDKVLWGILDRRVNAAMETQSFEEVEFLGVDETSVGKGHDYVSIFAELSSGESGRRVVYVAKGADSSVFKEFGERFEEHGGKKENVKEIAMDMSSAFIAGASEEFPDAEITFDHFHVSKLANKAVDETRRAEVESNSSLKKTRYALLKREDNLKDYERELLEKPEVMYSSTGKAYQFKCALADWYDDPGDDPKKSLVKLAKSMIASKISKMKTLGKTLFTKADRIVNYFKNKMTTGFMEGINSLVQSAKSKARGYRSIKNLKIIIYLIGGKLPLKTFPWLTH